MEEDKYTLMNLLKYLLGFIRNLFAKKREKTKKDKARYKRIKKQLSEDYKKIDKEKDDEKKKDVKDRFSDMFGN